MSLGIKYVHYVALGGKAGDSPEAKEARERFLKEIGEGDCMVCMEANPDDCHRKTLLEPLLVKMGFKVVQIWPRA